jgi:hypothetical protein
MKGRCFRREGGLYSGFGAALPAPMGKSCRLAAAKAADLAAI